MAPFLLTNCFYILIQFQFIIQNAKKLFVLLLVTTVTEYKLSPIIFKMTSVEKKTFTTLLLVTL